MLKQVYVGSLRFARSVARSIGLLKALEGSHRSRFVRWLRSLFSIYDIDELVAADLAWWTFEAMDQVDAFLKTKHFPRVFEYGSGASSIWLARRGCQVWSVDHDAGWLQKVETYASAYPNLQLRSVTPKESATPVHSSEAKAWRGWEFNDYVAAIDAHAEPFDLIVVDGRSRNACFEKALQKIAPGGIILFDNSSRQRYQAVQARCELRREVTRGLTPTLPYPDQTTLFYAE